MRRFWLLIIFFLHALVVDSFSSLLFFVNSRQGKLRTFSLRAAQDSTYDDTNDATTTNQSRRRVRPIRRGAQLSDRVQAQMDESKRLTKRQTIAQQDPNLLVDAEFSRVVSPPTARALKERLGITDRMTLVQGRTFHPVRQGESVVVQAATGSGKTLAFLIPLVERLLAMDALQFQPEKQIGILIIAPTRELAVQIADAATDLVTFHSTLAVKAVYGGTSIQRDVKTLESRLPAILVATPGRLLDLIRDERIRGRKFADVIKETIMVVLDEADLLVLGGFSKDILEILSHLPRKRQTLLFSATIPKKLQAILPEVCSASKWTHIDCMAEKKDARPRIEELILPLPGSGMTMYVPSLLALIKEILNQRSGDGEEGTKIMVFFPAVRVVRFFADVFRECAKDIPVLEIHSNLSQSARRRVADAFRRSSSGVLLTSDVSARGLDYPEVDVVIQYGVPRRRDLYLHRLGRTGRAGNKGKGILVPMPFENFSVLGGKRDRIKEDKHLVSIINSASLESIEMTSIREKIKDRQQPLRAHAEACVLALLAYYVANKPSKVKMATIRSAVLSVARSIGLGELPDLSDSLEKELSKS